MQIKKKIAGIALLACAGTTVLASCNDVEARPADDVYYQSILNLEDIVHNQLKDIYDAVVTAGSSNSETVLNNILYNYAETMFGTFYGDSGLKEAYINDDESALQAIADTYSVYEGSVDLVRAYYEEIVYRIEEEFLTYVQDETYQTRSVFEEEEFYDDRIAEYYDLVDVASTDFNIKLVDGSLRIDEGTDGYDDSLVGADAYFGDILDRYEPYIEVSILPDIYRNLLTSQYLITQNYRSLGLSYARKIDVVALSDNSDSAYVNATRQLMDAYSTLVINAGLDTDLYGFEFLVSLYKGTYEWSENLDTEADLLADAIYKAADWTKVDLSDDSLGNDFYYRESGLGDIYYDYEQLTDNRFSDDDDIRSDFTGDGAYSPEIGFQIKYQELVATSYTTHGWYTSTSIPDDTIPSDMQTRLFRMNVANEVDFNLDDDDETYLEDYEMTYGWYKGGNYYLIPANYENGDTNPYLVYEDGTWYIIKVEEAVKTAKLSETNSQSYNNMPKHDGDGEFLNSIALDVAYALSSNDTYTTSAQQYYVEQMCIFFHDDDVYDYFKDTFSGLFND